MSILKFENRTPRTMEDMHRYMKNAEKTGDNGVFGIGVNPCAPVQEMQFVQDVYYREELTHPYVQVILSFDSDMALDSLEVREISMEVGKLLVTDERQVFGAIHYYGTDNVHCHYMINYVGIDGKLYRQGHHVNYYKRLVNAVMKAHGLRPVKVLMSPPFIIRV
ncbi:relaxase/mobilization nuclease domain-containing protein [Selenomonas sp. KH1T6]|uniref:relaxase/mobilization nuclease domain-containing protein n=1 Tax=Selenomonas sp. KH1T6 TaxID=3158784 RepID=UPI0008A73F8E|nr:Relaxase/Mobilisation nuclease domain-containing protein [Selenomonas ruminantium]